MKTSQKDGIVPQGTRGSLPPLVPGSPLNHDGPLLVTDFFPERTSYHRRLETGPLLPFFSRNRMDPVLPSRVISEVHGEGVLSGASH